MRLTRARFVATRKARWDALERLLLADTRLHKRSPQVIAGPAAASPAVSADLMRARALGLGLDVISHLNSLSSRAHNLIYGARPLHFSRLPEFLLQTFPGTVRRCFWPCFLASLAFYVPLVLGLFATLQNSEFA